MRPATVTVNEKPRFPTGFVFVPLLLVLLSGCGSQPLTMGGMSVAMNQQLDQAALSVNETKPKVVRLSQSMDAAVLLAVSQHEAYQAALSAEKEALESVGVAESVRFPQLSANANLGVIREDGGGQDETTTGGAGGVDLSQLIYDGGESAANVNVATAEALAARAERLAQGNELALQAANAWIDVWQYSERLQRLRDRTGELDTLVSQIERMASSGMLDRAALESARREIVTIQIEESGLVGDLEEARVRFRRFFGHEAGGTVPVSKLVSLAEARVEAKNWNRAPGLQRSVADLIAARNSVAAAESAYRPRARFQAGVTAPLEDSESTDTTAGLVIEYTFGDGGKRQSRLRSATAGVEAATARFADARYSLKTDLESALARLRSLERSMTLVSEKIRLTTSEAETARSQIVTGQSSLRLLVDAEIENFRARDQQVAMRAEMLKLQLSVAARTGALGRVIGLETGDKL